MSARVEAQSRSAISIGPLPFFITQKNRLFSSIVVTSITTSLYLGANHFHLSPPQYLSMSIIDRIIPFFPYSIWIYLSAYILLAVVFLTCKDLKILNKFLYSYFTLWVTSSALFTLWPTTYPRQLFPLPADLDFATATVFNMLRTADSPANCCPSLHVGSVFLGTFLFLDEQKEKFPLFFLWSTAVAFSTMSTKQHYSIDVVAGLFMAIAIYWFFHRLVKYKKISRQA